VFTPWHLDDLNAALKKNAAYALFRRPVGDDLEPVWPEKWPRDKLDRDGARSVRPIRAGVPAGVRAGRQVPVRVEWVRVWTEEAEPETVLLSVDPAVSRDSRADASALVTLGRNDGVARVLEAVARRVAAPELVELIDDTDRRWHPDVILFESNAAFAAVRDLLVRHTRFGARVRGVVQTRDKTSRMNALAVTVENKKVLLRFGLVPVHPRSRNCSTRYDVSVRGHDDWRMPWRGRAAPVGSTGSARVVRPCALLVGILPFALRGVCNGTDLAGRGGFGPR
jgi:phage terminase large subunit-like protein